MLDADDMLHVTSLSTTPTRRRMPRTVELANFETTGARDQEAITQVSEMREQIERKEAEVARLREQLERDNEVDMSKAPEELKRLQAAFDKVQKMCAARLAPVEDELKKYQAKLEGKQRYMQAMSRVAKERVDSVEPLRQLTEKTTMELDDPKVSPIDESPLKPLIVDGVSVQTNVDTHQRTAMLDGYTEKQMEKLNEEVKRALKDATDKEGKEKRRVETARKDIEVRCKKPKVVLIDDEWVDANKQLSLNLLKLQEVNHGIKIFNEEIAKLSAENRDHNTAISQAREQLIDLEKYIPVIGSKDDGSEARGEMVKMIAENECLKLQVMIAKSKLKVDKSRLTSLEDKLNKQPAVLEEKNKALEKVRALRVQADDVLDQSQVVRSDLMSRKEFLEDQKEAMSARIKDGKERLRQISEETAKLEAILKRQKLMIALHEEMMALRKTNLGRVAGIVSNLLQINSEMNVSE